MALASEDFSPSNALKFEKLNGGNYRTWSFNIRLYLESLDLFEHVDGTAEMPDEDPNSKAAKLFRQRAKKAWTYICLAVDSDQQIHVRDTQTAAEAWNALKAQFARTSILQKVRLRQEYYSSRFFSGGNMLQHINRLKSLHEQLKEMGAAIDDQELAMTLLSSLPEEFKPLITALDAVGEDNITFEKVKGMLLNDIDRNRDIGQPKSSENALFVKRSGGFKKGPGRHYRTGSTPAKFFRGTCHFCKEQGHFARDCPKKQSKDSGYDDRKSSSRFFANYVEIPQGSDEISGEEALIASREEALKTSDSEMKSDWIIDSGATQHMIFNKTLLKSYVKFHNPLVVNLGDNRKVLAFGKGSCHIVCDLGLRTQRIVLNDVLYLPDLKKNLLSVRAMTAKDASVEFAGGECKITRNGKLLAIGQLLGKLYFLKLVGGIHVNLTKNSISEKQLWHYRLGHLCMENVKKLSKESMVKGMKPMNHDDECSIQCESCIMGKQHRNSFPKASKSQIVDTCGSIIHSDVCGPMPVNSIGGSRYFVTFIDNFSKYTHIYFIKQKSEVLEKFKEFVTMIENITENHVKILRSDNGGEYTSKLFDAYLKEKGIIHQTTVPNNPAQNGTAERMNRTIMETARTMMCHANVPQKFWAEAVNTAVYLRNRSPTVSLKQVTPYEHWTGEKPDLSHLKVFGCVAYIHVAKEKRNKFDAKSRKAIFVGYPAGTKGYKLFDISTGDFVRSRDVVFAEEDFHDFVNERSVNTDLFYPDGRQSESAEEGNQPEPEMLINQPVGETYEDHFMQEVQQLGSLRERKAPRRLIEECNTVSLTSDIDEPGTINEAWQGNFKRQWKEATDSEYQSLISNHTWELVSPPSNKNIVGNRWIFKVKRNSDGTVDRFKARLVAQGYSQTEGIDYDEVFSPVARYTSIRSLLALATVKDWHVHQMDVKTAFLQGSIDTEIFMEQPVGYVNKSKPNHVCKLQKSIYGLKQAARCWNLEIDTFLQSNGYTKCSSDGCIYIKSHKQENGQMDFVILSLWVDDILLFSNNMTMMREEKKQLHEKFVVVDQGEVHYVLGMLIKRDRSQRTMTINQENFLRSILKRYGMEDSKPVSTPLEPGKKFKKLSEAETSVEVKLYQQMIGSLTYVATATRPDIAAAVNILSKYMARPGKEHMEGVKRILRYVKGTINYGLCYNAKDDSCILAGYADADWAGDNDTRHSTSGYIFQLYNNTVSWCSKKQNTVAKSTTEAEYVALSFATQEVIWLRRLLENIGMKAEGPSTIFEDNNGAIELSKNPKFHNRTKHIDVAHHFVREQVALNNVSVKYCSTQNMLADGMTKGLTKDTFQKLRSLLGVKAVV